MLGRAGDMLLMKIRATRDHPMLMQGLTTMMRYFPKMNIAQAYDSIRNGTRVPKMLGIAVGHDYYWDAFKAEMKGAGYDIRIQ